MVQGYYTLEEAARILGMAPDQLSQMAQRREVRAFADRGTWRFRTQDIEELGRRQGLASDPDLQLGEAPRPKAHDSPVPKSPAETADQGVFQFSLGGDSSDQVEIGQEVFKEPAAGGPKSSGRSGAPKSPPPKPGSDSDVRLVPEGSDIGFQIGSDSDVKVVDGPTSATPAKARPASLKPDSDSDVKIIPDSSDDNTVQLGRQAGKSGTDSDIRLEGDSDAPRARGPDDSALTEEIDLDAELRKAEEASQARKAPGKAKVKPSAAPPPPPASSPFELSGSELEAAKEKKKPDSSSDFELKPLQEDTSPIELGSDEMKVLKAGEEVPLGEPSVTGPSSDSGINLQDPADSGISLEQKPEGSDEIEFELSLDAESTPRPAPAAQADSDSEFELTLDDSGRLAPLEEEAAPAKGKGKAKAKEEAKEEDKDIFETDFEVPALDESGSQAVALDDSDTDLESSDFDLALGEEDIATEEESGSQVVVLEDEDADEGAATVARKGARGAAGRVADEEGADLEEILGADEDDLEEATGAPVRPAAAPVAEADWGLLPILTLAPTVLLMFIVGLMSFELIHGMWGYRQPHKVSGVVVKSLSGLFGAELPKD
jgi:hypothetical protein